MSRENVMSHQKDHEYRQTLRAEPERVWAALTDPEDLTTWLADAVEVDLRPGGAFRFWGRAIPGAPAAPEADQVVESLEPGKRLAFSWTWAGVPTRVELTLEPDEWKEFTLGDAHPVRPPAPGCALTVRQRFEGVLPWDKPENLVDDHWRLALGNLSAHLDQGELLLPDYTDPEPEVRLSLFVQATPAAVFRALSEPELLNRWMAIDATVDLRVGGSIDFGWSPSEPAPLEILELVPDRRLVLSWPDWRGQADEPHTRVRWDLVPEAGGTRIEFLHSGFRRPSDRSDYLQGWSGFLDGLIRVAQGL